MAAAVVGLLLVELMNAKTMTQAISAKGRGVSGWCVILFFSPLGEAIKWMTSSI